MFKKAARSIITSKREDFDALLKRGLQKQREEVATALGLFPYFDDWTEDTIKETCSVSNVRGYLPNKVVLDGTEGASHNFTYFILEGSCCVIHRLRVRSSRVAGQCIFKLAPDQNASLEGASQNIYMQTCIFRAGVCFGLGENLQSKWITAQNNVKCLRIPLHVLMANNKGNVWCRIRQFLDLRFPSVEEVFRQFVTQRTWTNFRRLNFERCIKKKNVRSGTRWVDVPYCCRVNGAVTAPLVIVRENSRRDGRSKGSYQEGGLELPDSEIRLLEEQNKIYEDFLDTLAQIRLRSVFK